MAFCLTKGNVDDRVPIEKLTRNLQGLAAADKGYISKKLKEGLQKNNLKFITKVRRNMKKKMRAEFEEFFLAQRSIVETIIEQLKSICQIEHSRHRTINFLVN